MNFSGSAQHLDLMRSLLAAGEELVAVIDSGQRLIGVSNRRIILIEEGGNMSSIRNDQIGAIEISQAEGAKRFVKVYFGGGLSRTISAPDPRQAAVIMRATGLS